TQFVPSTTHPCSPPASSVGQDPIRCSIALQMLLQFPYLLQVFSNRHDAIRVKLQVKKAILFGLKNMTCDLSKTGQRFQHIFLNEDTGAGLLPLFVTVLHIYIAPVIAKYDGGKPIYMRT